MTLVLTSAGQLLVEDAAASYEAMNVEFTAHFGKHLAISSGSRAHQTQIDVFLKNYAPWNTGTGDRRVWNGVAYWRRKDTAFQKFVTVAIPGTSTHEDPPGWAADFGSGVATYGSPEFLWMQANAPRFGWVWTGQFFTVREPWHWEKRNPWTAPADAGSTPFDPEEDEMSKAAEDAIFAIKAALLDGRPQSGMTTGALDLVLEATTDVKNRIRGPLPWDNFQETMRRFDVLQSAVLANNPSSPVSRADFEAVVKASEDRLRAQFETQFADFGVALRAEIIAGLGETATVADVEKAFDAALGRLRLTVSPAS